MARPERFELPTYGFVVRKPAVGLSRVNRLNVRLSAVFGAVGLSREANVQRSVQRLGGCFSSIINCFGSLTTTSGTPRYSAIFLVTTASFPHFPEHVLRRSGLPSGLSPADDGELWFRMEDS